MNARRLVAVALLTLAWGGTAGGDGRVPEVLVERHTTVGDTTRRITLFDNRMAVASVQVDGEQVFLRKLSLAETEFAVYVQVLEEVADAARGHDEPVFDDGEGSAIITLDLPGKAPRTIRFSVLQVLDLETSRLVSALDDLELRVSEASPSQEALRHWTPREGDRVELFTSTLATVSEVRENGLIVLTHDGTGIIEVVPVDQAARVILRVLP